jgi:predicted RNA-binding protein with PUA-like domain
MQYWLMKSEPDVFSIDDLAQKPNQTERWDGVRNFQVRNWLRDAIKSGDQAFFYHSSCAIPAIVGIMQITSNGYPDPTAFDTKSPYYDPKSSTTKPIWYCIDVCFIRKFKQPITLPQLKQTPHLQHLKLLQKGNRLSILPLAAEEWQAILALEHNYCV